MSSLPSDLFDRSRQDDSIVPLPSSTQSSSPDSKFNEQQELVLDLLVNKTKGETMQHIAEKAGVARMTIWRWLQNPLFKAEYVSRVESELGSHRALVAQALVAGALRPGIGQAAMQKLYWQKLGEVTDKVELTGKDGGPIEVATVSLQSLSPSAKREIITILERERALKQLTSGEECDRVEDIVNDTVEAEYTVSE